MSKPPSPAVAKTFSALGDKTRLAVLARLGVEELSASELAGNATVTRQAIVKHLQVLENAGLVSHRKRGREVLYTLDGRRIAHAQACLAAISAQWDRALNRLRQMVESEQP